ncbi:MAG: twin-arginine translocation signal domain-containing protein [Acidimicrobiia bacterium]|nr:twin-arginine translocation signal domain-containing protein [Acidimicrobiia bacterium]
MMERRDFLRFAAALPATLAGAKNVRSRSASRWEIVYKSPHPKPNDLDINSEGLWILDQGPESWVSLVDVANGKVIREFKTDVNAGSGVTVDEHGVMWISSTHNSLMVSCSPKDGKTIAKYWTPGAGRIYQKKGDAEARRSKLKPAYPPDPAEASTDAGIKSGLPYGQLPLDTHDGNGGTGAHGIVAKDGMLYFVVPPARFLVVIDPKSWIVQKTWPVPGSRPHGLTWDENRETLWNADSNLNAFFRFDLSGKILETIQLADDSPVIHGATLHQGYMICCDDVGWIWRFRI